MKRKEFHHRLSILAERGDQEVVIRCYNGYNTLSLKQYSLDDQPCGNIYGLTTKLTSLYSSGLQEGTE